MYYPQSTSETQPPCANGLFARLGWEPSLGLLPHDQRFRSTRKVMGREIGSKATAANYDAAQEIEAAHFMLRLLDAPAQVMDHIKK